MEGVLVINGESFINVDALVKSMVKECVLYTDVNDYEVSQDEANTVRAFQSLLKNFKAGIFERKFKEVYVRERFVKRTM